MRSMAGRWSDQDIAASLNRMGMPTGQGKTWTAHRVGSVRRVRGIHGYLSAEKSGEWLTLSDAAAKLGVSHHQVRKLIKAGVLVSQQIMPTRLTRSAPLISRASRSPPHSNGRVTRVGLTSKIKHQCFQTLEKEVQNESVIAMPRNARSAALLLRQMRPSSQKAREHVDAPEHVV